MNKFLTAILTFFNSLFSSAKGSISSKRVCGVLGWVVVLSAYLYCTFAQVEAPTITVDIVAGSVALLGVDSVTRIWHRHEKEVDQEKEI